MPFANRRPGVADLLYVMAAEPEYGPELRSRISPLICGIGPVEAAASVTERLTRLAIEDRLPLMVVSLGSAGSAELEQCGLYQASSVSWRDVDATALGFEPGVVPNVDQPAVIPLGPFIPGIPLATLSTGADVVSGAVYDLIDADMVDMETYAVLRACQRFGLPLISLRGISDGDRELGSLADWTQYLDIIDVKLGEAVDRLEAAIAEGSLTWGDLPPV
ncbi:MAG TPA: 5'-methylthioadenosine/S-adenosylhomocysteine nucleosidase [Devosia sp.]|jgi:adenosylhomocysteine nucleosidase|nr:5'-methylthioadenosine/S-adenosylhomocysteine nucleosidase [Devosia sp.]